MRIDVFRPDPKEVAIRLEIDVEYQRLLKAEKEMMTLLDQIRRNRRRRKRQIEWQSQKRCARRVHGLWRAFKIDIENGKRQQTTKGSNDNNSIPTNGEEAASGGSNPATIAPKAPEASGPAAAP